MIRQFALTAALIACAGSVVWTQTDATFTLSNGERHSGTLVYGRGNNNIVDDRFHLNSSGIDKSFALNQVAIIDFTGGGPAASDLQSVPNNTTGLMVRRNGSIERGTLHNILGDLVQWMNEAGQRQNHPIGEISRLYLNGAVARAAISKTAANTPGATARPFSPGAIRVDASQRWAETGIVVRRGERLSFDTSGEITLLAGATANAAGRPGMNSNAYPVPQAQGGTLIGRVGNSGPFPIGSNTQPIVMPADGRLMLGVNDDHFEDNSGFFTVNVTRRGR